MPRLEVHALALGRSLVRRHGPRLQGDGVRPLHKVAILQSNYIPWKGYFDLIRSVDEFIFFDDVQYTRQDWRNRNQIKTPEGKRWLTIPVHIENLYGLQVKDTLVAKTDWRESHCQKLWNSYRKAPCFAVMKPWVESVYAGAGMSHLSQVNQHWIRALCEKLGIGTRFRQSTEFHQLDGKTERLVDICRQAGATHYLSGPSAKDYLEEGLFAEAGIELEYFDYAGYPEYPQLYPPFDHAVTILDLLFHVGDAAREYLRRPGH